MLPIPDGINSETADEWSETPLLLSGENRRECIAKTLLERNDNNPVTTDTEYR